MSAYTTDLRDKLGILPQSACCGQCRYWEGNDDSMEHKGGMKPCRQNASPWFGGRTSAFMAACQMHSLAEGWREAK